VPLNAHSARSATVEVIEMTVEVIEMTVEVIEMTVEMTVELTVNANREFGWTEV